MNSNNDIGDFSTEAEPIASATEITPAMIEAGLEAYSQFDDGDPGSWLVCSVYRAMRARECRSR
jgi:hypothetical protein